MSDEDGFSSLSSSRIAIIGLGLMGGSLAMALQKKCACLMGLDPDPGTINLARQLNLVSRISADPQEILPDADAVILAAPIQAIIHWIGRLPEFIHHACIVLDLGSTKSDIIRAMTGLPENFQPVGGHPICGKEVLSLSNAEAGLFKNAPFIITPLARTTRAARMFSLELVQAMEARPLFLDAETHDHWIAFTSHLPYLLSISLALATPLEAAPLAGPGFRSASRLAATPDSMMLDVLLSNRTEILQALSTCRLKLDELETALSDSPQALQQLMRQGSGKRAGLV